MPKTTAEVLGQYQLELVKAGVDPDIINDIVRDAAFELHHSEGISVGTDAQVAK